jgi:hypothetical protein
MLPTELSIRTTETIVATDGYPLTARLFWSGEQSPRTAVVEKIGAGLVQRI